MDIFIPFLIVIALFIIALVIYLIRKLEHYPFLYIVEDISGKRKINDSDFVDKCLCKATVRDRIIAQPITAANWKTRMLAKHPS